MKMPVRYQAAIVQDDQVLLLKIWDHAFSGKTFWLLPGGGRIEGESEEECVRREVREETHLEVEVGPLLLEEPDIPEGVYERLKTYLCTIKQGTATPGTEPEIDTDGRTAIQAVGWFDLRSPHSWEPLALNDPITSSRLYALRAVLGYATLPEDHPL